MTVSAFRTSLFVLAISVLTEHARAVNYTTTILSPPIAANHAKGYGISVGSQVGIYDSGSGTHAVVWSGTSASAVDLHPAGYVFSRALAVSGGTQVGEGQLDGGGTLHALQWSGSAASVVDLNPTGFFESTATGASGESQVGWGGQLVSGTSIHHALLWQGTAASAVDLKPAGYGASEAYATSGGSQVGYASLGGSQHALLWNGTAASRVDLHPNGWSTSFANGVSGNVQVGSVWGGNATPNHAALWQGSAASFVDLNPVGFSNSVARATTGDLQVGYGNDSAAGGSFRALLWSGSAANVINLHQFLASTGGSFAHSFATGIAADGTIIGYAGGASASSQYAVLWTPSADFNENTVVDAADYVLWRKGLGTTYNESNYDLWRSHFGEPAGSGAAVGNTTSAAVPEPRSLAVVACALIVMSRVRMSRRNQVA